VIPYELIIPCASRPHLLLSALESLLARVDQQPARILLHDDVVFPGAEARTDALVQNARDTYGIPIIFGRDNPPLGHGPTLKWLLDHVQTEYVLYSQDDLFVRRDLPIAVALATMHQHRVHQIRFNKRATMEWKGAWHKREFPFPTVVGGMQQTVAVVLTIADHWYFQTGLWRVARIKPVVDFWMEHFPGGFGEHAEPKLNNSMNRGVPEFNYAVQCGHIKYELPPDHATSMNPDIRAQVQRTFIWGKIGEEQYIDNLATKPEDWALLRPRGGRGGPRDSQAHEGR
jgi:hypothetical protein